MSILKDLTDQTTKILSNVSGSLDDIASLTKNSVGSAGSLIVLRGKIETEKKKLNKLYQTLGKDYAENPEGDFSSSLEEIEKVKSKLNLLNSSVQVLNKQLQENANDLKDTVTQGSKSVLDDLKEELEAEKEFVESKITEESQKFDKEINEQIEQIQKQEDAKDQKKA